MGAAKMRDEGRVGIGGNVRQARESCGLSEKDLCERWGWSVAFLKEIEENRRSPTNAQFETLMFVLGFPKQFFFRPDEPPGKFEPIICGSDVHPCVSPVLGRGLCGYVSDYLCDFPMGEGKTCDLALCERHAIEQSKMQDMHLCPQHSVIARGMAQEMKS